MLQWSNSEHTTTPSHDNSHFMPMSRSITKPTPSFPHGPAPAMTDPTSSLPTHAYDGQYQPPAHCDGSPYNTSTDYTHHPPSQYPMQVPHSFESPSTQGMSTLRIPSANLFLTKYTWYSGNYYQGQPAPGQEQGKDSRLFFKMTTR